MQGLVRRRAGRVGGDRNLGGPEGEAIESDALDDVSDPDDGIAAEEAPQAERSGARSSRPSELPACSASPEPD